MRASLLAKILGLAAALTWSIATVMLKRWRAELAPDLLNVVAWQFLYASAILIPVALWLPEPATRWTPTFVAILAALAFISTTLGWFLWLYILERLPTWQASLSVLGVPAVAILTSRLQLGEAIEPLEAAGMLLIGAGLALLSFLNWREHRRARSVGLSVENV